MRNPPQPVARRERRRSRIGLAYVARFLPLAPSCRNRALDLPNEMLEYIFILAQQPSMDDSVVPMRLACSEPLFPWARTAAGQARSSIALVCRHWREVLQGSRRAWQQVDICVQTQADTLASVAARSGSTPLFLRFLFHDANRPWGNPRPLALGVPEQCELLMHALRTFSGHSERWTSLSLVAQEPAVIDTLFEFLHTMIALPTLTSFAILYTGQHLSLPTSRRLRTFPTTTNVHGLKALVLRGCRVDWQALGPLLAGPVTSVTLEHLHNTTDIATFLHALSGGSSLEELRLGGALIRTHDTSEAEDDAPLRAILPALETLSLGEVPSNVIVVLMCRLEMRSLRTLQCDMPYTDIPPGFPDQMAVRDVITSADVLFNPASLSNLTLRRFGIRLPAPLALSTYNFYLPFRGVTTLSLDFRSLQIEYWTWLLEATQCGALPSLSTLTVAGLSVVYVQEYICIRLEADLPSLHLIILCDHSRYAFPDDFHVRGTMLWLRRHTLSLSVHSSPVI